MKHILVTMLLLLSMRTLAQDDDVFNRVNGVKFQRKIYLRWNPSSANATTKWECRRDNDCTDCANWHSLDELDYFNIRNDYGNDFKVLVQFYNPLKYALTSTMKDVADPTYNAINEYISKLPDAITPSAVTVTGTQSDSDNITFVDDYTAVPKEGTTSILLFDWLHKFNKLSSSIDTSQTKIDLAKKSVTEKTIKKYQTVQANANGRKNVYDMLATIKNVEQYLYDGIQITKPDKTQDEMTLSSWLKSLTGALYAPDNYASFKDSLQYCQYIVSQLQAKKDSAEEIIGTITDKMTKDYDKTIAPYIGDDKKYAALGGFKQYTASVAAYISLVTASKFADNDKAIAQFSDLCTKLKTFSDDFKGDDCGPNCPSCGDPGKMGDVGYRADYTSSLNWKSEKMETLDYKINKINADGSIDTKSGDNCEFTVAKRLTFYSFISTGILYTNFVYPNFSLDANNKVVRVDDTKVNLRPTPFLNMLITSWDPVYPFVQLGITVGKNDALFPLGVGISIQNKFSISGGALFGYVKTLNKLHEGDVSDPATLESDLTKDARVSWYFSVNYNISSK